MKELPASPPAWVWVCKREHSDNDVRLVVMGEECPNCGATEPLSHLDVYRDNEQR